MIMPSAEDDQDGSAVYRITHAGAELLRAKIATRKYGSYKSIGKRIGYTDGGLHGALSGRQQTCRNLPALCDLLEVPFYKTQPLDPNQIRILDALKELEAKNPDEIPAAITSFERTVAGTPAAPKPRSHSLMR